MPTTGTPGSEHGLAAPGPVDPTGESGPTRGQVRASGWRRTSRGLYVRSEVEQSPQQRVLEAGVLLPPVGAVTGWGALCWYGGHWFSGLAGDGISPLPVPVASPRRSIRPQPLLQLCEERFSLRDTKVVDGIRTSSEVRATAFAMRYAGGLIEAVVALDMACFHDLVSIDEVRAWVDGHPSYTGIEQARDAVVLADENAWSPMEVLMRLDWPGDRPLTNRPLFDLDGRHIGTPDLLDPDAGVIGEYEGALHLTGMRRASDLRREETFRVHGLEPVTMVAEDVREPGHYRERLRSAYARAARRPAADRRWTLERPPFWPATVTVAQRRALDATARATWLRHRAG